MLNLPNDHGKEVVKKGLQFFYDQGPDDVIWKMKRHTRHIKTNYPSHITGTAPSYFCKEQLKFIRKAFTDCIKSGGNLKTFGAVHENLMAIGPAKALQVVYTISITEIEHYTTIDDDIRKNLWQLTELKKIILEHCECTAPGKVIPITAIATYAPQTKNLTFSLNPRSAVSVKERLINLCNAERQFTGSLDIMDAEDRKNVINVNIEALQILDHISKYSKLN